jgi:hypothetical protein
MRRGFCLTDVWMWPEAHMRMSGPMSAFEGDADIAAKNVNFG